MNKYEITTVKKKNSIINAALSLFKENGYTNVNMKEIAALAHVSQVSIYNYFGSKETLFGECVNIVMSDTLQRTADLLTKEMSFKEKIKSALSLCTEEINLSFSDYFTQEALNDAAFAALLMKNINEKKNKIYRRYIELGKQEKVIDSTIPTDTILELMEILNTAGMKQKSDEDMSVKIKHIHHLFLYGLIGRE